MIQLETKPSLFGMGVFTNVHVPAGTMLIEWKGRTLMRDLTEDHLKNVAYMTQIGHDEVTVKSDAIDDYVNHSCRPNCGLRFEEDGIFLYSIEEIPAGSELFWDYSTTMTRKGIAKFPEWREECFCNTNSCRKIIDAFAALPDATRERYTDLAIVPEYVLEDLS